MTSTAALGPTIADNRGKEGLVKWLITITVAVGAMLEVVDTSIVNVALREMQGNLGATLSEIGWVVTGYGIANAVIIPLSAWLGDYFGKKSYWIFSLVGFTFASVLCGLAPTLPLLVTARILQGLFGGGLLAKAQAILFETFPPHEQGIAQGVFGISVVVGPVIGPTLGGYITDTLGWRWIFFINVPIGIIAVALSWFFLKDLHRNKVSPKIDFIGIALLIITVGSLQTVLEQGHDQDWFNSSYIIALSLAAVLAAILFIWRELRVAYPAVDLRVLRYRSVAGGSVYSAVLGAGLYGALFAVPIFAQSFLQYTPTQTGLLLVPGALATAMCMPILGRLNGKVDARILIAIGSIGTSVSMFLLSRINAGSNESSLFWPLLIRGASMAFMFLPMTLATLGPVPRGDVSAASGFYNLMRQLGGSIGIAVITTLLAQRENFHRSVLVENVTQYNPQAQQFLAQQALSFQARGADETTAQLQAYQAIDRLVDSQAALLSFADLFWLVSILFIVSMGLLFFLGSGKASQPGPPIDAH